MARQGRFKGLGQSYWARRRAAREANGETTSRGRPASATSRRSGNSGGRAGTGQNTGSTARPNSRSANRGGRTGQTPAARPNTPRPAARPNSRSNNRGRTGQTPAARSSTPPRPSTPTRSTSTRGGNYPTYSRNSDQAKSFRAAFRAARNAGQKTFTWEGRRYSTAVK